MCFMTDGRRGRGGAAPPGQTVVIDPPRMSRRRVFGA